MELLPGDEGTDSEVVHRGHTLVLYFQTGTLRSLVTPPRWRPAQDLDCLR